MHLYCIFCDDEWVIEFVIPYIIIIKTNKSSAKT